MEKNFTDTIRSLLNDLNADSIRFMTAEGDGHVVMTIIPKETDIQMRFGPVEAIEKRLKRNGVLKYCVIYQNGRYGEIAIDPSKA